MLGNSLRKTVHTHCACVHQAVKLVAALLRDAGVTAGLAESNGSLLPDYDSHHLQADCQEPGSASEPYTRQSSMGYLYPFYHRISRKGHDIVGPVVRPPVYTLAEKPTWLQTLIFRICMVTTIACWEHESQSAVMNSTVVMVMQSIWHQSFINGSLFSSLGLCSNVVLQVHWGSLLKSVNRDSIISRTVQSRRRDGTGQNAQNMCGDLGNWWVARGMDVLHVHPTSQERRS